MILGLALPARVVIEEGLLCGRCSIDADSLAAPRHDPRARREVPGPRTRAWKIACRWCTLTVVCVRLHLHL